MGNLKPYSISDFSPSDGIRECEDIIKKGGGEVSELWMITYRGEDDEVWRAIQYLLDEWDYGFIS